MPQPRTARTLPLALAIAMAAATVTTATAAPGTAQAATGVPAATTAVPTIDLVVLVVDDGQPMVRAVLDRLRSQGVKTRVVALGDPARPTIDATFLSSAGRGLYCGIVLPSEMPAGLTDAERQALSTYESTYGVREVDAYTWANPAVGLSYAANPGYVGAVDGMTATLTPAATSGSFSYLKGSVPLDDIDPAVSESWGYLATPLPAPAAGTSFTPYLTATIPGTSTQGSLLGVYTQGRREQMVITFASNASQQHFHDLAPGIVDWVTRGVATSYWRSYFSVHVDDVFMADAEWSVEGKCTIGDGCDPVRYPETAPGATSRMVPADVTYLKAWQQANGLKIDQAFNGGGSDEYVAAHGSDPLLAAFAADAKSFRWINHTYDHPYLGCVQDFTTSPWQCAKNAAGAVQYASWSQIQTAIAKNRTWATTHGIPFTWGELVTGEHSGLKSLPQMPADNPNLASALTWTAISSVASDASREQATRTIGTATTIPRHPMSVFYNTSTKTAAAAEYNWMYTSAADGGSGSCTEHPDTTTCISPIDLSTGYDSYVVPLEARIDLGHVTNNDPRPHYAHQSNLTGDRILYPVLDRVVGSYRSTFAANAPLVNPTQTQAGQALVRQEAWAAAAPTVTAKVTGSVVTVTNTGTRSVQVPLTAPTGTQRGAGTTLGAYGEAYAGARSAWTTVLPGTSLQVTLPAGAGFPAPAPAATTTTTTSTAAATTPAVDTVSTNPAGPTTTVVPAVEPQTTAG